MAKGTQETHDVAVKIMDTVKSIYPQLKEFAEQTDFVVTISGEGKKVYFEMSMDWDPTADPE